MSASGNPDPERLVSRMNSDATQVGEDYNHGDWSSTEKAPLRFGFDQPSPRDKPYDYAPSKQSKPSKSHSPFPPSQAELQEQTGEKPWRCGDTRHYDMPKNGDGWQKCNAMAEKYDNEMCDAWKDEVDKLLIFAGLFSAAVTAFTTQSYQWLGEQSVDSSARLLSFIATQLANSTNPLPPSLAVPEFTVTQAQIRINVVWFLSLTLSLTTVIGILCLQWLREFQRDAALPHKDAVALRQMRYEGLINWHVPGILSVLPLLLQLSLILFFIGLLDLLWSLNTVVAACVSAAVGIVMLFLMITTALPALQHALTKDKHLRIAQCPYKSPQSWLFYRAGHWLFWLISSFNPPWSTFDSTRFHRLLKSSNDSSWLAYDMRWRRLRDAEEVFWGTPKSIRDSSDVVHGLHWINDTFTQSVEAVYPVYHSLAELDIPAAAATISEFYLEVGLIDDATFRVMMDDRFSPTEVQKRDIVAAYYLQLHQDRHPVLKTGYVETVIRILNTQDLPSPFYDWLSQILQDLASRTSQASSVTNVTTGAATQVNTEEIIIQILLCVKSLIARDLLRTLDVAMAWALLRQLLTPPPPPPPPPNPRHSTHPIDSKPPNLGLGLNLDHISLASGLFEELEMWLSRGKEMNRWERVKLCVEGMIRLFPSFIEVAALDTVCPIQMGKAAGLVRALDVHMSRLGGAAAVLGREREKWWHEFFGEEACEVEEWAFLVSGFEVIEESDE